MRTTHFIRLRSKMFSCCAGLSVVLRLASSGHGQVVTLTDRYSSAEIDPYSQRGMFQWSAWNQNSSNQRWFWYRLGSTGPQQSIDTISAPLVTHYGTREASILYTANTFTLSADFLLTGGALPPPGQTPNNDIGQSIRISNTSSAPLAFHFFQYSHFSLSGAPFVDTVQLGRNLRGLFNDALQYYDWGWLTETITTPGANHAEVAYGTATLDRLNTRYGYNLNDEAGPLGAGDVSYAFQWDLNIAPYSSALISDDMYQDVLIPEPSAQALFWCALVSYAVRRGLFRRPRTRFP